MAEWSKALSVTDYCHLTSVIMGKNTAPGESANLFDGLQDFEIQDKNNTNESTLLSVSNCIPISHLLLHSVCVEEDVIMVQRSPFS